MFIFVALTLFSAWIWVDQTEKISMGLTYSQEHMEFIDLDLDGDEDMIRLSDESGDTLEAFENILTPTGWCWKANPDLLKGISFGWPYWTQVISLGAGDLNSDGRKEIVAVMGGGWNPGMNVYINKGELHEPNWVLDTTFTFFHDEWVINPDFVDVDGDGELDMLGYRQGKWDYITTLWWNRGTPTNPKWEMDTTYFDYTITGPTPPTPVWIDCDMNGVWDILVARWDWYDPPPCYGYVGIGKNTGTALEPTWEYENLFYLMQVAQMELLDWNQDGTEDLLIPGDDRFAGYKLFLGKSKDGNLYFESPPLILGGIFCNYSTEADVNQDGIPEIITSESEYQMDLWGDGWTFPCFLTYTTANEYGTLWKLEKAYGDYEYNYHEVLGHLQYVDFNNDQLIDYVISLIKRENYESPYQAFYTLLRNQGTKTQPAWVPDSAALSNLPPLFPACFLDIDGDGDKDVIGVPAGDSFLVGYINTGSDYHPHYARFDVLVSGLEGIKPTFMAAGDITDNDIALSDLAAGIKGEKLTAFFNTGQANPRWQRHEEVFKGLGINGNPSLCDADSDGDLDLYLVAGGRLRYYNNQSTGGIEETLPVSSKDVTLTYLGPEIEIRLSCPMTETVHLSLYNAAGQRVEQFSQAPEVGEVRFLIAERPGVYFYKLNAGKENFRGKIVIY